MKFSRDDEREADRVGVEILRRAGWNPRGLLTFLETLRQRSGRDPSSVEVFLSTHPSLTERIADLRAMLREELAGRSSRRQILSRDATGCGAIAAGEPNASLTAREKSPYRQDREVRRLSLQP